LEFSPAFAFQSRVTPRQDQIKMQPSIGFEAGVPLSIYLAPHLRFLPCASITVLKNRTVSRPEGINANYIFGDYKLRYQFSLDFQLEHELKDSLAFIATIGTTCSYGRIPDYEFSDSLYTNQEKGLSNYNQLINSGVGLEFKKSRRSHYVGIKLSIGLRVVRSEFIQVQQQQTTFADKSGYLAFNYIYFFR
jgi:hypothetical protein